MRLKTTERLATTKRLANDRISSVTPFDSRGASRRTGSAAAAPSPRMSAMLSVANATPSVQISRTPRHWGLFGKKERAGHDATITSIEVRPHRGRCFAPSHTRLREITTALHQKRQTAVDEARERLERSGIGDSHPDYARIDEVLDRGRRLCGQRVHPSPARRSFV